MNAAEWVLLIGLAWAVLSAGPALALGRALRVCEEHERERLRSPRLPVTRVGAEP